MIRTINRLADRLVGMVVPSVDAGACVPEMGWLYWNYCGGCGCRSDGRWIRKECQCRINCYGACVSTGATRCVVTGNLC